MIFLEKFFSAHFSDQKTRKNFKKSEKFEKLPKLPHIIQKLGKTNLGTKMTFFEKIFFAHFSDQKTEKFQKKWKILKSSKKGPKFKNCQIWPKSFRIWVKPILGTKKWLFSRIFFRPFFRPKNSEKFQKK